MCISLGILTLTVTVVLKQNKLVSRASASIPFQSEGNYDLIMCCAHVSNLVVCHYEYKKKKLYLEY